MTRPLLIIKAPYTFNPEQISEMRRSIGDSISNEYLILMVKTKNDDWSFECFHEKDLKHTNFEELKKLVTDSCA
jgi:hypothetical protein